MKKSHATLILTVLFLSSNHAEVATPATLLPAERAAQVVVIRNVTVKNGTVSGETVNQASRPVRDVQLLIRYSWRWKNELKPGNDDFGRAEYHTVKEEILPGKTAQFSYKPSPPLPSRPDGYFETTVSVAGFTEVIQ